MAELDGEDHMLTTVDNPFNPFTEYDQWLAFDEDHGYYSNSLLARVAIMSDDFDESIENFVRESAIDEIVRENTLGLFRKVSKSGEGVAVNS